MYLKCIQLHGGYEPHRHPQVFAEVRFAEVVDHVGSAVDGETPGSGRSMAGRRLGQVPLLDGLPLGVSVGSLGALLLELERDLGDFPLWRLPD